MKKVEQSMLAAGVEELRVIPNGVDLSVFHPGSKENARQALGLPRDQKVLLFTARGVSQNTWKDFKTMRTAVVKAAALPDLQGALFVVLGEAGREMHEGNAKIRFFPYQSDRHTVALFYQAADVYLHAAVAETFGNSLAEAMACGTPVVATATGGIPEIVSNGTTGLLVPPRDPQAMADRVEQLLTDDTLREKMSVRAADVARSEFSLESQASACLRWYMEVCDSWSPAG